MITPNLLRGHFYNTHVVQKCHMYHPCTLTLKCQNYDPNRSMCYKCEQRVRPQNNLRGFLAEGIYEPDLQLAQKIITEFLNRPMISYDGEGQKLTSRYEISKGQEDYARSIKLMEDYAVKHIKAEEITIHGSNQLY